MPAKILNKFSDSKNVLLPFNLKKKCFKIHLQPYISQQNVLFRFFSNFVSINIHFKKRVLIRVKY